MKKNILLQSVTVQSPKLLSRLNETLINKTALFDTAVLTAAISAVVNVCLTAKRLLFYNNPDDNLIEFHFDNIKQIDVYIQNCLCCFIKIFKSMLHYLRLVTELKLNFYL